MSLLSSTCRKLCLRFPRLLLIPGLLKQLCRIRATPANQEDVKALRARIAKFREDPTRARPVNGLVYKNGVFGMAPLPPN